MIYFLQVFIFVYSYKGLNAAIYTRLLLIIEITLVASYISNYRKT